MTIIQKRLVQAHATLVMAERETIEQVPETEVALEDGTKSTLRAEVDVEIAKRTVEALS